jgi:ribosomal protein S12 methylthiotransferase accessory factor YcaO
MEFGNETGNDKLVIEAIVRRLNLQAIQVQGVRILYPELGIGFFEVNPRKFK